MREGWEYKKLGEVGDVITGSTPSTKEEDNYNSSDVCFVKPSDIPKQGIGFLSETEFYISRKAYNNSRKLPKGSVLTTCIGIIGKVGILNVDATCNQQINAIIPYSNISSTFLAYSILSKRHYLEHIANAPVVPIINKKEFSNTTIPIPPLAEQERIVAELDLLSSIIDKKKAQLKELDQLAQSIFYTMFGDPITNPKGWEIKNMGELFDIGSSKRVFESQWEKEGVPFYRAREIVKFAKNEPIDSPIYVSEELYQDYSNKYGVPSEGDIMVTAVGTLGVCYIVKKSDRFYFKDGNILWFKNKGLCESRFIVDQYATPFVMNQIQGNANAAVVGTYTITNAKKTKVIVPPLELQKNYLQKIEAIEKQKALVQQSIAETQTLFDSRMDHWFS